ncbi:MAG: hypothetical protein Q8L34_00795 [Candidatus Woesearchaeota archaeon]|nr:hypothetical protein [Candidatus Woesearchaeota archaeon]
MATTDFKDKKSSCLGERRPIQELFEQDKEPLLQISKKALETMKNKDPNDWLSRLMGSAKLKKFTKEEQEHWFDDYESVDTSNIFREHGLD